MANGEGGSRAGGFFRGVLTGLVVCAIAAVVLSLYAPLPERTVPGAEAVAPDGDAVQGKEPAAAATPEADSSAEAEVIVVPAEEPAAQGEPPSSFGAAEPRATGQPSPASGDGEPVPDSDAFSAPQNVDQ